MLYSGIGRKVFSSKYLLVVIQKLVLVGNVILESNNTENLTFGTQKELSIECILSVICMKIVNARNFKALNVRTSSFILVICNLQISTQLGKHSRQASK